MLMDCATRVTQLHATDQSENGGTHASDLKSMLM
jgi:hypothetical protein